MCLILDLHGNNLKRKLVKRLLNKRDSERIEMLEKDPSFRDIKFLVCNQCFYLLSSTLTVSEAELQAIKYKTKVVREYEKKRDQEDMKKYLKYVKEQQLRDEKGSRNLDIALPDIR